MKDGELFVYKLYGMSFWYYRATSFDLVVPHREKGPAKTFPNNNEWTVYGTTMFVVLKK